MNPTKPLVIVKSLKGTGVNPASATRVIQAITPPSEEKESHASQRLAQQATGDCEVVEEGAAGERQERGRYGSEDRLGRGVPHASVPVPDLPFHPVGHNRGPAILSF